MVLRELIDVMDMALWELDTHYRIAALNRRAQEVYGENATGDFCYHAAAGRDSVCPRCPVRMVYEGAPSARSEHQRVDARGKKIYTDCLAAPIRDEEGRLVGASVLIVDITEHKRAEARQAYRLQMKDVLSEVSGRFVDPQDLDQAINQMLQDAGAVLNANRAYLLKVYDDGAKMDTTHEWVAEGTTPRIENLQGLETTIFPWWMGELHDNGVVVFSDVSQWPSPGKETLEERGNLSVLIVPIFTYDTLYGFLGLDETEQHREWDVEEVAFLGNAAQILGRALECAQARRAMQQHNLELAARNALAQALAASLELQDVLDEALSRTLDVLGFAGGLIALADERTGNLTIFDQLGLPRPLVEHLQARGLDGTLCDIVYRRGKPLGLADLRESAPTDVSRLVRAGLFSYVGIPIVYQDRTRGVLCVFDTAPHSVDRAEYALLTAIGQQIGVAVENARLFEETQRRAAHAALIYEVGQRVSGELELDELLSAIVTAVHEAFDYYGVMLMLVDEEAECLTLQSIAGGYADVFPDGFYIAIGEGMMGYAALTGETQVSGDVSENPHYVRKAAEQTKSELAVPIKSGQTVIGVLDMHSNQLNAFDDADVAAIEILSSQVATAIENAQLYEEAQRRAEALEEANVRLQELDRLKDQFLASMSHELRTPLSSILGFSEVLVDGLAGELSGDQGEFVGIIHASGKHLLALINDILDLSKIEAGRMKLRPTTFDVAELLLVVETTIAPMIEKKSQVLTVESAEDLPLLTADRIRIEQALLNLLSNAHRFTPKKGQITLSCRLADPATMLFSVADTGIGIKPEDQKIIYEEFRQVVSSPEWQTTGTGLGLAISKRLIEMHGGRIWVESEYRRGSTFFFLLPLAGPSAAEPEAPGQ